MAKNTKFNFSTVITVDPEESMIRFTSMTAGDESTLNVETKKCKTKLFDREFFDTFQNLVTEYAQQHPSAQAAGVTLVLPDRAVATDTVSIPTLRRRKTGESLEVAINELYKNSSDLKINHMMAQQNKQYTTYSLAIMQTSLLTALYTACSTCKMIPQAVTYAANATVNAVLSANPKLHNATFMMMDVKANTTRISFVSKGHTCGYYSLPFGYSILEHNRLAAEDMLFDHSQAELIVLNAKEKAKAKQLTMMRDDTNAAQVGQSMSDEIDAEREPADPSLDEFAEEEETQDIFTSGAVNAVQPVAIKTLPKKQPRKLPKFMLREQPHSAEEYAYENFRLFVKWALNLIQSNKKQLWQDKPEAVFVNLPKEYNYLFEMVNEEKKDNGVSFLPADLKSISQKAIDDLESYGGFFATQFNESNNF